MGELLIIVQVTVLGLRALKCKQQQDKKRIGFRIMGLNSAYKIICIDDANKIPC